MKYLMETGVVPKIKHGVKLLGRGSETFKSLTMSLGVPINFEISDATQEAVAAVQATGGTLTMNYRTPLLMR